MQPGAIVVLDLILDLIFPWAAVGLVGPYEAAPGFRAPRSTIRAPSSSAMLRRVEGCAAAFTSGPGGGVGCGAG